MQIEEERLVRETQKLRNQPTLTPNETAKDDEKKEENLAVNSSKSNKNEATLNEYEAPMQMEDNMNEETNQQMTQTILLIAQTSPSLRQRQPKQILRSPIKAQSGLILTMNIEQARMRSLLKSRADVSTNREENSKSHLKEKVLKIILMMRLQLEAN